MICSKWLIRTTIMQMVVYYRYQQNYYQELTSLRKFRFTKWNSMKLYEVNRAKHTIDTDWEN